MPPIDIARATPHDLEALAGLFDAYRVFYGQVSDRALANRFLGERMRRNESVAFLARDGKAGTALGFVQLYPAFSSVAAERIWILNDLFVAPAARHRGVARALLRGARDHAAATGAVRLVLETAADNRAAQALYAAEGWQREDAWHYCLALDAGLHPSPGPRSA